MNAKELLERLGDSLGSTATVKSVFGEPIQQDGRTVVPIARVAYGFGAGGGGGDKTGKHEEGGGGGGGVRAFPAGALEITSAGTRFIPFMNARSLIAAFGAGLLLGALLIGRRRR